MNTLANVIGGVFAPVWGGAGWSSPMTGYRSLSQGPTCPCCGQFIGYANAPQFDHAIRRAWDTWHKTRGEYRDDLGRVVKAWAREGA